MMPDSSVLWGAGDGRPYLHFQGVNFTSHFTALLCPVYKGAGTTFQQVGWGMADMVECPGLSGMWLVFS